MAGNELSSFNLYFVVEFWLVVAFTNTVYSASSLRLEHPFVYQVPSLFSCSPAFQLNFQRRFFGRLFLVSTYVETEEFLVLAYAESCRRLTPFDILKRREVELFPDIASYHRAVSFPSSPRIILLHFCLFCCDFTPNRTYRINTNTKRKWKPGKVARRTAFEVQLVCRVA